MSAQFARAPHRGSSLVAPPVPHAALLIDFDNVTMGIRSDLSKELKNLLSSDIIKGKVAVQRAYADWRRYPQYIVPLAESSVDLIFAPAYGSSKKNATDIRLAIDALELVFTRPEIGTFILLSGDSDFSSLVLKLKEYGKYVIGVGIRESASDLLVQNCDEYYSYSALTGLTRAGDEQVSAAEDPWELVELAIKQMAENNDVMRSDRLKQVILEMDPSFDEKALGFQKFNRFMQEAAGRGLVSLKKLENGQFEVGLPGSLPDADTFEEVDEEQRGNGRRTRRGRGRGRDRDRDRDRGERAPRADTPQPVEVAVIMPEPEPEPSPVAEQPEAVAEPRAELVEAAPAEVVEAPREERGPEARGRGRGRGRGRDRDRGERTPRPVEEPAAEPAIGEAAAAPSAPPHKLGDPLRDAYGLLRRAVGELVQKAGEAARDSDIKRRMLELREGWDESALGFSKFSRFLRQAHDAEVINLRKLDNGAYEAALASAGGAMPAAKQEQSEPREERGARRGRDRDRDRGRGRAPQRELELSAEAAQARPSAATPAAAAPAATAPKAPSAPTPAVAAAPPRPAVAASPAQGIGIRRGSRGRSVGAAPPPLLEGQIVTSRENREAGKATEPGKASGMPEMPVTAAGVTTTPAAAVAPAAAAAEEPKKGRGAKKSAVKKAAAKVEEVSEAAAPTSPALDTLGLPTAADEVIAHLTAYAGVGPKSVQSLVEAFGAAHVFEALHTQPERVREIVTGARGERLLEAWQADYGKRVRAQARKGAAKKSTRGRRGGRKRGGKPAKTGA